MKTDETPHQQAAADVSETVAVNRRIWSGRQSSARSEDNDVALVNNLIVSQEDKPQSHRTVRKITPEIVISRSSVVKKDLRHV